ncbi:hypothetical protein ACFL52_04775 [Candidatus Margulisiibacteriota bacterium]
MESEGIKIYNYSRTYFTFDVLDLLSFSKSRSNSFLRTLSGIAQDMLPEGKIIKGIYIDPNINILDLLDVFDYGSSPGISFTIANGETLNINPTGYSDPMAPYLSTGHRRGPLFEHQNKILTPEDSIKTSISHNEWVLLTKRSVNGVRNLQYLITIMIGQHHVSPYKLVPTLREGLWGPEANSGYYGPPYVEAGEGEFGSRKCFVSHQYQKAYVQFALKHIKYNDFVLRNQRVSNSTISEYKLSQLIYQVYTFEDDVARKHPHLRSPYIFSFIAESLSLLLTEHKKGERKVQNIPLYKDIEQLVRSVKPDLKHSRAEYQHCSNLLADLEVNFLLEILTPWLEKKLVYVTKYVEEFGCQYCGPETVSVKYDEFDEFFANFLSLLSATEKGKRKTAKLMTKWQELYPNKSARLSVLKKYF